MARVDLTLGNDDASGATLMLPRITGMTDQTYWPGCITNDADGGGAQGLTTKELCRSMSASFLARNAVEVDDSTSEIWGDRTLVLKAANIRLGNGVTEGQRLTLFCAVNGGCTVTGENARTNIHIDNGKIRDVFWDNEAWVLADRQNTAIDAQGDKLVLRDTDGRAQVTDPVAPLDIATKNYVDTIVKRRIEAVEPPVGFVYTQYPSQPSPETLWPHATWKQISYQYAGAFFRAEDVGQDSSPSVNAITKPFEGGKQAAQAPNITGHSYIMAHSDYSNYQNGALKQRDCGASDGNKSHTRGTRANQWFDASFNGASTDIYGNNIYTNRGELRPENYSIRLWKRIE